MTDIARSRTIAAKLQAVWDVLADFDGISGWAENVTHSCVLDQTDGDSPIGSSRRVQVGRNALVERIVLYEPPYSLAYDIEGLPPRLRTVRNRWDLAPVGDRSTEATLTTTVEIGPRPPQRIAERVVGRVLAKQSDVMLAGLAAHLENSP